MNVSKRLRPKTCWCFFPTYFPGFFGFSSWKLHFWIVVHVSGRKFLCHGSVMGSLEAPTLFWSSWVVKKTWLFRVFNLGDEILPSFVGITMIHYKDPYWLGFVFVGGDFLFADLTMVKSLWKTTIWENMFGSLCPSIEQANPSISFKFQVVLHMRLWQQTKPFPNLPHFLSGYWYKSVFHPIRIAGMP